MKDPSQRFNAGRTSLFLTAFIAAVVGGATLKLASSVILPFTIALLLAFALEPLVRLFQKWRIPRIFAICMVVGIVFAGLYLFGRLFFSSARTILSVYPKYERRLTEIYLWAGRVFDLSYDEHLNVFENLWNQLGIRARVTNITFAFSNDFLNFFRGAVLVTFFVVFILIEAVSIGDKVNIAFKEKDPQRIKRISNDVIRQVTRYLSAKFFISLATGIIVSIGLGLVGLEFAIVWGTIQFVLNFIPTFGSIAAGVGAGLFALLQFWPNPGPVAAVSVIMLGTNMAIGNVLEPKIMGDNLGLSPLVVLMALAIWGYLWGFAGMVLAVPMMVITKILCENVPFLVPLAILLSSRKAALAKKEDSSSLH